MAQACKTCARGWLRENGLIGCGAAVDDNALHHGVDGSNPIWAQRKYGVARVRRLLAGLEESPPVGIDCDNMDPDDGVNCLIWEPKTARSDDASIE